MEQKFFYNNKTVFSISFYPKKIIFCNGTLLCLPISFFIFASLLFSVLLKKISRNFLAVKED